MITIEPMQWGRVGDLHATPELDQTDEACMADIRAVLERHGKLDRFAIHLAHLHFALQPDEVLI